MRAARDIEKDLNEKSAFPTFEEFKNQIKSGTDIKANKKTQQLKNQDIFPQETSYPEDKMVWGKYFDDLKHKIKIQREKIKHFDQQQETKREKSFNDELQLRLMQKVQQKKIEELQKSMINNKIKKTDRFYLKVQNQQLPLIDAGKQNRKNLSPLIIRTNQAASSHLGSNKGSDGVINLTADKFHEDESLPHKDFFSLTRVQQNALQPSIQPLSTFHRQSSSFSSTPNNQGQNVKIIKDESEQVFESYFNFKLKDFMSQINKCKEKDQPIEFQGIGFNSCKYAKLLDNEKQKIEKAKQSSFHESLLIQKQFLKSSAATRKKEHQLFEQLQDELLRMKIQEGMQDQPAVGSNEENVATPQDDGTYKKILKNIQVLNQKETDKNFNYRTVRPRQKKSSDFGLSTGRAFFNLNKSLMQQTQPSFGTRKLSDNQQQQQQQHQTATNATNPLRNLMKQYY